MMIYSLRASLITCVAVTALCFSSALLSAEAEQANNVSGTAELIAKQADIASPSIQDSILNELRQDNQEVTKSIFFALTNNVFGQEELDLGMAANANIRNEIIDIVDRGLMDDAWLRDKFVPYWWLGFYVLASYFPGDPQVEMFFFESLGRVPEVIHGDILEFFAVGKFESDRVQEFRLASLRSSNLFVARRAIKSIGLSSSPDKLDVLEEQLSRRDAALVDVVESISTIDMDKDRMKSILEKLEILKRELVDYEGDWEATQPDLFRIDRAFAAIQEEYDL